MKVLRCVIADDEPIARQILENYIEAVPFLELKASCKNAFEVLDYFQENTIDILFLDINMPKLSGLSLLKTMTLRPEVVLTTAYPEYAIEGFELSVADYLLKPFSLERFIMAVTKIKDRNAISGVTTTIVKEEINPSLFVKSDKKLIKLNLNEIGHIEAFGNYIKIYTDMMILVPQTLSSFLERLPVNFLRIHKSYIINFDQLKLIEGNQLMLQNGTKLPIGKVYRKTIIGKLDGV